MNTKIALFQFNACNGDIVANAQAIVNAAERAKAEGAQILVTPELALSGASCEDLIFENAFWQQIQQGLDKIEEVDGVAIVVGHPSKSNHTYYNSASVFLNGSRLGIYHKMVLNHEGTSDEVRYFEAGVSPLTFQVNNTSFSVLIADDITQIEPAAEAKELGANALLVLGASPFYLDKQNELQAQARFRVEENNLPIFYTNMVGGQDELVYDGASFAINADGTLAFQSPVFEESLAVLTLQDENSTITSSQAQVITPLPETDALLYQALVLAMTDYIHKNGFKKICLGLSGGIDSALVLAIAVDAIGAENCEVIIMPSQYTAQMSVDDAEKMAQMLKVKYSIIAISPLFEHYKQTLAPIFNGLPEDTTEENLQARIRGDLLMALSNKTGALLLTTGNKSEVAMGYCTLYGDMCGGFALIKDLLKTQVFALSRHRNTLSPAIPERIIERPPSAELKADQVDQDTLPEYAILDAILTQIMEQHASRESLLAQGFSLDDINQTFRLMKISEFKRQQGAIGPKLSKRAFGKDWRIPICHKLNK